MLKTIKRIYYKDRKRVGTMTRIIVEENEDKVDLLIKEIIGVIKKYL